MAEELQARAIFVSTHSHISKRCLAAALRVSSSITTGHYVLNKQRDVDPKRLGSENDAMKETQNKLTLDAGGTLFVVEGALRT